MEDIVLQTERLYMLVPTMKSLGNWYKLKSDKDVMRHINDRKPKNKEEIKEGVERNIDHYKKYQFSMFDVFTIDNDDFVGIAGLNYSFVKLNYEIELAYTLCKKHWGKGYATELAKALIKWVATNNFDVKRIVACCYRENIMSSNVLKKCKMVYDGQYLRSGKYNCDIYKIDII